MSIKFSRQSRGTGQVWEAENCVRKWRGGSSQDGGGEVSGDEVKLERTEARTEQLNSFDQCQDGPTLWSESRSQA